VIRRSASATRADYGEAHLRRLRLIRALVDVGEVPVAAIAKILAVVDDESAGVHQMLGAVQYQLGPHPAVPPEADPDWQAARREVDELIADLGWTASWWRCAAWPRKMLRPGTSASRTSRGSTAWRSATSR
jgi:hypothetical protein